MRLSLSLHLSLCLSLCLPVCLSVSLSVCLSLSLSLSLARSLALSVALSLSVDLSLYLCFNVYVSVSLCLSLCLSLCFCVSIFLSVCLSLPAQSLRHQSFISSVDRFLENKQNHWSETFAEFLATGPLLSRTVPLRFTCLTRTEFHSPITTRFSERTRTRPEPQSNLREKRKTFCGVRGVIGFYTEFWS